MVYDSPGGAPALGRVVSAAGATEVTVERLEEDAVNLVWLVAHEAEQRVPASGVRRTVQADYLQLVSGGGRVEGRQAAGLWGRQAVAGCGRPATPRSAKPCI